MLDIHRVRGDWCMQAELTVVIERESQHSSAGNSDNHSGSNDTTVVGDSKKRMWDVIPGKAPSREKRSLGVLDRIKKLSQSFASAKDVMEISCWGDRPIMHVALEVSGASPACMRPGALRWNCRCNLLSMNH